MFRHRYFAPWRQLAERQIGGSRERSPIRRQGWTRVRGGWAADLALAAISGADPHVRRLNRSRTSVSAMLRFSRGCDGRLTPAYVNYQLADVPSQIHERCVEQSSDSDQAGESSACGGRHGGDGY